MPLSAGLETSTVGSGRSSLISSTNPKRDGVPVPDLSEHCQSVTCWAFQLLLTSKTDSGSSRFWVPIACYRFSSGRLEESEAV